VPVIFIKILSFQALIISEKMELKDVKKVISSITKEKGKVLILDKKENLDKWEGFKCISYDELQSVKDSFDVVVVNDLENITSKELAKVGSKFIILNPPFDEKLTEKSDETLDKITSEKLNDEMKFLDKILGVKENITEKKKLSYVILEKEDLISKPSFFFNLALIQNLKKQIAEREKTIASQIKDIEILTSRVKHLERCLDESETLKKQKDQEIKNLQLLKDREKKELIKKYGKQINDLQLLKDREKKELFLNLGKQLEQKEKELQQLRDDFAAKIKDLEREQARMIKAKEEELEKLKDQLKEIKSSLTFRIVSGVTKHLSWVKKWLKSQQSSRR
jgi:hypothetical protein